MSEVEAASREFLQALIAQLKSDAESKEIEYVIEHIFPVLVPGEHTFLSAITQKKKEKLMLAGGC